MTVLSRMKVSTRLVLGFGIAVALGVLIAAFATWRLQVLAGNLDELASNRMLKVDQFRDFKDNMNATARAARNIVLFKDEAARQDEKKKIAEVRVENAKLLAALDKSLTLPKARELLQSFNEARGPYAKALDQVVEFADKGQPDEAVKLLSGKVRELQAAVFKALDASVDLQQAVAQQLAQDAAAQATRDALSLATMALAIGLVGGLVAWTITRSLTRALGAEPAQVSDAVRRVADGDLTSVITLRSGDDVSTMAAVKRMQDSLSGIVASVRGNSESVATASAQIAQGNTDLSQRTEQQASALQQTAATMDELGTTVRNNADNARQANQLALGASGVAAQGGEVVGRVVDTMKGINASSRRIADIISVIDGIAFQTNILALNAAVEAARAGEQGRGFAVVASEVRSLAQRSAAAAKEIKTLINASVEQVEQGTVLVDQAGHTMEEIVGAIKRVSDIVAEISAAGVEQSAGVSQVGLAVTQMDQATQQNAALVEESAAAAESLKQQALALVQAVAVFRLGAGLSAH